MFSGRHFYSNLVILHKAHTTIYEQYTCCVVRLIELVLKHCEQKTRKYSLLVCNNKKICVYDMNFSI